MDGVSLESQQEVRRAPGPWEKRSSGFRTSGRVLGFAWRAPDAVEERPDRNRRVGAVAHRDELERVGPQLRELLRQITHVTERNGT